jgi:hypothetical protein
MRLSLSHYLGYRFGGLTRVFLMFFYIKSFFNFIFQHWIDWKLNFIICFLLSNLDLMHDSSCGFGRLTSVDWGHFLSFFFYFLLSILSLLKIMFHNLFLICFLWDYNGLITQHAEWQVNLSWPGSIQYVVISIFI